MRWLSAAPTFPPQTAPLQVFPQQQPAVQPPQPPAQPQQLEVLTRDQPQQEQRFLTRPAPQTTDESPELSRFQLFQRRRNQEKLTSPAAVEDTPVARPVKRLRKIAVRRRKTQNDEQAL